MVLVDQSHCFSFLSFGRRPVLDPRASVHSRRPPAWSPLSTHSDPLSIHFQRRFLAHALGWHCACAATAGDAGLPKTRCRHPAHVASHAGESTLLHVSLPPRRRSEAAPTETKSPPRGCTYSIIVAITPLPLFPCWSEKSVGPAVFPSGLGLRRKASHHLEGCHQQRGEKTGGGGGGGAGGWVCGPAASHSPRRHGPISCTLRQAFVVVHAS